MSFWILKDWVLNPYLVIPSCGLQLKDCRDYITQNALRLYQLQQNTHQCFSFHRHTLWTWHETPALETSSSCMYHRFHTCRAFTGSVKQFTPPPCSTDRVWMRNNSLRFGYLSKVSMVKLMSGLLRKVQNCLGVDSPVLSPQPAAGRTTATGNWTASRPSIPSRWSDSNFRKSPGSPGRRCPRLWFEASPLASSYSLQRKL